MSEGETITQALEQLERILVLEAGFALEHSTSNTALNLNTTRTELLGYISKIGRNNKLSILLAIEKGILQGDLERYSNSKEMLSSLNAALIELDSAERHIQLIQDKDEYHYVNLAHSLPKRRQSGLPMDEARQAFDSHHARLSNLNKARLDIEEKLIINARKNNIAEAKKMYIEQQKEVLGIK
ncbi:MAG: hypothetical protein Q4G54_04715 [Pelistega sp.]|nr:hypothetical protein [Pelistega sp.]